MATPRPTPTKEEAHIFLEPVYNTYLVFPASLASEVLPKLRVVTREYVKGDYSYVICNKEPEIKLLSAEMMLAAAVTAALKEE